MAEFGLAGPFSPHHWTGKWFPSGEELPSDSDDDVADAVTLATENTIDYLADVRAKRILMELRGLEKLQLITSDINAAVSLAAASATSRGDRAADNVVVNDESRWKSAHPRTTKLWMKGTHRAYVLRSLPANFPGISLLLSFSGSAQKLTVMEIVSSDIAVKVVRPHRKNLHIPLEVPLPEPLVVIAHSHTSWNNSTLYK
jgi:hypothetical protein